MVRKKKQFCINGHDTFVTGRDKQGKCKLCKKEWARLDYLKRKEYIDTKCKEYYGNHREELLDYQKEYANLHKEKISLRTKKYQKKHKEEIKVKKHKYYLENKIELDTKNRQWAIDNSERKKEADTQWRKDHPNRVKENNLRGKIKRKSRIVKFGQRGIKTFYRKKNSGMEIDHIIPLQGELVSGLHVRWNLQYLTPKENSKKSNKINLLEASIWYGNMLEEIGIK